MQGAEEDDMRQSEIQSNYLMLQYFQLINTHMHGLPGGKVESESFSHDFSLPKCYIIPHTKLKEIASLQGDNDLLLASSSSEMFQLNSSSRCKQFPDKVLFYIFYNMPHDKAQLNASIELQTRGWFYLKDKMLWIKQNLNGGNVAQPTPALKKDTKKKSNRGKKDENRTVLVFNP